MSGVILIICLPHSPQKGTVDNLLTVHIRKQSYYIDKEVRANLAAAKGSIKIFCHGPRVTSKALLTLMGVFPLASLRAGPRHWLSSKSPYTENCTELFICCNWIDPAKICSQASGEKGRHIDGTRAVMHSCSLSISSKFYRLFHTPRYFFHICFQNCNFKNISIRKKEIVFLWGFDSIGTIFSLHTYM